MDKHNDKQKQENAEVKKFRGVDINAADDNKVDERLVKQDIKLRNDNPHSDGL